MKQESLDELRKLLESNIAKYDLDIDESDFDKIVFGMALGKSDEIRRNKIIRDFTKMRVSND